MEGFRPRSFTLSALDNLDTQSPPSSPIPRPSSPPSFPPSMMLPPSHCASKVTESCSSTVESLVSRLESRQSFHTMMGDLDPKLSSSVPSSSFLLEARLEREMAGCYASTENASISMRVMEETDILSNEAEAPKDVYGHTSNGFSLSNYASESDVKNLSDDDGFEYNTDRNLADRFMYHYSFNDHVARPIDLRGEVSVLNGSSTVKAGISGRQRFSSSLRFRNGPALKPFSKEKSTQDASSAYPSQSASTIDSAGATSSSYASDGTIKDDEEEVDEARKETAVSSSKKPSAFFSTSPLLGFALERARANCFPDEYDLEDPPEFTLDVS